MAFSYCRSHQKSLCYHRQPGLPSIHQSTSRLRSRTHIHCPMTSACLFSRQMCKMLHSNFLHLRLVLLCQIPSSTLFYPPLFQISLKIAVTLIFLQPLSPLPVQTTILYLVSRTNRWPCVMHTLSRIPWNWVAFYLRSTLTPRHCIMIKRWTSTVPPCRRFSVPKICHNQHHCLHREVLGPLLLHSKHLVFHLLNNLTSCIISAAFHMKMVHWTSSRLRPLHQFILSRLFPQHLVRVLYPQLIYPRMTFRRLDLCYSLQRRGPESLLWIPTDVVG